MVQPQIIRFDSNVKASPWPDLGSELFAGGPARQSGHYWISDPDGGYGAGVWQRDAHSSPFAPYPVNALYLLLDGQAMVLEKGRVTRLRAGDAVIIPKGTPCTWRQTGALKAFFAKFDGPAELKNPEPLVVQKIHRKISLLPTVPPSREVFLSAKPKQRDRTYFVDATQQFNAGVWESTPYASKLRTQDCHEWVHLIQGSVTITDSHGNAQQFNAADTFLIPRGTPYAWTSDMMVRKLYCKFQPGTRPAQSLMS